MMIGGKAWGRIAPRTIPRGGQSLTTILARGFASGGLPAAVKEKPESAIQRDARLRGQAVERAAKARPDDRTDTGAHERARFGDYGAAAASPRRAWTDVLSERRTVERKRSDDDQGGVQRTRGHWSSFRVSTEAIEEAPSRGR